MRNEYIRTYAKEENNMSKISVIGAGSVGATVANDLMIQGVASEIVLVDINQKKAIGEALDIYQGAPFSIVSSNKNTIEYNTKLQRFCQWHKKFIKIT